MREVNLTVAADVAPEKLWDVLADYGGFLKWAGSPTDEIRNEGDGLGMIRHLKMGGGELAEKLTLLEPDQHRLGYELVYGEPIGMKEYSAVVQILGTSQGSEIVWRGEFESKGQGDEDAIAENLAAAYQGMTQALIAYASR